MTTAVFRHIDLSTQAPGTKPWTKVDASFSSHSNQEVTRPVADLRGARDPADFTLDSAGFALHRSPAAEKEFVDDAAVRGGYYAEVEAQKDKGVDSGCFAAVLRTHYPGIKKVVIFDHTIRRRTPDAVRTPVQVVHVDQTSAAAAARVRRHLPAEEAEELLRGRFQIVNVWRPIGHPASDHPLAVIDWRSTRPADFVPVDLLYPKRADNSDDDDRGKEVRPDEASLASTEGYEVRGETLGVQPKEDHRFYYVRDMTPDEVLLLKCYDSFGEGEQPLGRPGVAVRTPHTAFEDPQTPADAPPRQSIEVRCLVFYE
ncbi:hypothetical protein DL766_003436 [Monosporascus sp. MC13-8B]|uniref:Methyltransferase n=1 Tax=Monosporascus cannonballus TaxID=155416 RepID=A0ABY0HIL4_9PEZI|nr:hypothetical protein DL762_001444 [Monosporascus cannonballus]RYP33516.1 hypothetical protein DL766_003436 [Monosporascus sp. MC13-8B]